MSRECQNCGSAVSDRYARVFAPNGVRNPRCCPECTDLIRRPDGTIEEPHQDRERTRGNSGGVRA